MTRCLYFLDHTAFSLDHRVSTFPRLWLIIYQPKIVKALILLQRLGQKSSLSPRRLLVTQSRGVLASNVMQWPVRIAVLLYSRAEAPPPGIIFCLPRSRAITLGPAVPALLRSLSESYKFIYFYGFLPSENAVGPVTALKSRLFHPGKGLEFDSPRVPRPVRRT